MQNKVLGRGLGALMPERSIKPETRIESVKISEIRVGKFQPRQEVSAEKMAELVASIKEKGVIQPVLLRQKDSSYELIAGERRLSAAKKLGFTELPAIIKEVGDAEALQLSLIENIQREELNPLEEAQAYQRLIVEFGFTQEKIAQLVGKDPSSVSNLLRLLKLPEEVQIALRRGLITMGHARTILAVRDLDQQERIFQRTITQKLSVRELENMVTKDWSGPQRKRSATRDPHLVDWEEQLQRILGTKVRIIAGRKRGKIVLNYYSQNELERLLKLLKNIK